MLKRCFDISLAGLGLTLSSPLWALIAAAIKLEDGGPHLVQAAAGGEELPGIPERQVPFDGG
jgi:lipopolysaccharide/colanic/teichoic acid biosynthesis glycosyltransferase